MLALCERGELADIIERNGVGLVATADDEGDITGAMERLLDGFERTWTPPSASLFDGGLRAAETAALLAHAAGKSLTGQENQGVLSCQR